MEHSRYPFLLIAYFLFVVRAATVGRDQMNKNENERYEYITKVVSPY